MSMHRFVLALSLPAALCLVAPDASAANTKPRPTFTLPPISATWVPMKMVDPCNKQGAYYSKYHWYGANFPWGQTGESWGPYGPGGPKGHKKGGPNAPFEKYAEKQGEPISDPVEQKCTEEYIAKLEAEAAKANGKRDWMKQTEEATLRSRDDIAVTKAGDYSPKANALQETRDAAIKRVTERSNALQGGLLRAPQPKDVPMQETESSGGGTEPAGGVTTSVSGGEFVIAPRE